MAHAEFDDLADIFHGPGVAGITGGPTRLTWRDSYGLQCHTHHGVHRAVGQSQRELQSTPCDSCDSCDSQALARAGGPKQGLRPAAIFCDRQGPGSQESQKVAGSRKGQTTPQTRANPQESQESQKSQGSTRNNAATPGKPTTAAAESWPAPAWSDADIARFMARRDRLIRWGYSTTDAEALADRLTRRDLTDDDDRVSCFDCAHHRPGRCGNHRGAGLHTPELGRDLATVLQRCPGFQLSR